MRDKSRRLEQAKLSAAQDREAAAAWNRVQKSMKSSKPVATTDRFKK